MEIVKPLPLKLANALLAATEGKAGKKAVQLTAAVDQVVTEALATAVPEDIQQEIDKAVPLLPK